MAGLLMPVDYLAELAGADFSPDPGEFYNEDLAQVPAVMADPAALAMYADPVTAAWGPPTEIGIPGALPGDPTNADTYFTPTGWQEDIANPVTYAEEDAWLPPTVTGGY